MTNKHFSWENLFSDEFQSREIDTEELEGIVTDAVLREYPGSEIEEFNYTDDGIKVVLENGDVIDIEVDWNEIILA